jgi:steroid 5-alpha reductase family enzyme
MITDFMYYASLIFIYMNTLFLIAQIKKDNSIVDVGWGIGFIIIALISFIINLPYTSLKIIITTMIVLWGIRLSLRIYLRNKGKAEDPRYAQWRKKWGKWVILRSYFQIYMLQGLIMLIIAYPMIVINTAHQTPFNGITIIGIIIWLTGFTFESIADYQLDAFLADPLNKGKICKVGLWKYSRHPNYFGESLIWWGLCIIATTIPHGWTTIISPLLITYLLLYVSGVPLTEKMFDGNEAYEQYKKTTNSFFPWFNKSIKRKM